MGGSNYPMVQHHAISQQLELLNLQPEQMQLFLRALLVDAEL